MHSNNTSSSSTCVQTLTRLCSATLNNFTLLHTPSAPLLFPLTLDWNAFKKIKKSCKLLFFIFLIAFQIFSTEDKPQWIVTTRLLYHVQPLVPILSRLQRIWTLLVCFSFSFRTITPARRIWILLTDAQPHSLVSGNILFQEGLLPLFKSSRDLCCYSQLNLARILT